MYGFQIAATRLFFEGVGKVPHVSFYNEFVRETLPTIPTILPFHVHVNDIDVRCVRFEIQDKPRHPDKSPLFPSHVRGLLKGTYSVPVTAVMEVHRGQQRVGTWYVRVFDLPVMVGSELCWTPDENVPGYFILNGVCRALLMQEHIATNKILVVKNKNKQDRSIAVASLKCRHPVTQVVADFSIIADHEQKLWVRQHFLDSKQPCELFLSALGSTEFETTQEEALEQIWSCFRKHRFSETGAEKSLVSIHAMFPQIEPSKVLGVVELMREKLIDVVTKRKPLDYIDALENKRFETCEKLIRNLVVHAYSRLIRTWTEKITEDASLTKIKNVLMRNDCNTVIESAFRTGSWVIPHSDHVILDVTEELRQENVWSMLSQLRRTTSASAGNKSSKHVEPRLMHPTIFGKMCMAEVVDGEKLGIAKQLALYATYSHRRNMDAVRNELERAPQGTDRLLLDGVLIGRGDGKAMRERLVARRRCGLIPYDVSISYSDDELRVCGDEGRVIECVFVAGQHRRIESCVTLRDALNAGVLEFLDTDEEWSNCRVVDDFTDTEATHVHIHPAGLYGTSASSVPFSNHNQAARTTFYTHMLKRAICPRTSPDLTFNSKFYELLYGQRPLVCNRISELVLGVKDAYTPEERRNGEDSIRLQFGGQNLIVCIASHPSTGEDAFVVKESVWGAGFTLSYDTYRYEVDTRKEHVLKTPMTDAHGVLLKHTRVTPHEPILMKTDKETGKGVVERVGAQQYGFVDETKTMMMDGAYLIATRLRQPRPMKVGNKLHFRPGQKGTIARVVPVEDMPYSLATGITPDVIINPNAFPSRMTVSWYYEGAVGKYACFEGGRVDGTPFHDSVEWSDVERVLRERGLGSTCGERMMDPRTGELSQGLMWMAPMFVQINAKFSEDGMYSRAKGPMSALTRQPTSGRSQEGAPRFGEMEVWTLIGHAVAAMEADRLIDNADPVEIHFCARCLRNVVRTPCPTCSSTTHVFKSKYAWVYVMHVLKSAGIQVTYML